MVQAKTFAHSYKGLPFNKIEHANEITRLILYCMAMHEVFMAGDQIQDASFFSWAAKALERDAADMGW
jgi:hypothetical protein